MDATQLAQDGFRYTTHGDTSQDAGPSTSTSASYGDLSGRQTDSDSEHDYRPRQDPFQLVAAEFGGTEDGSDDERRSLADRGFTSMYTFDPNAVSTAYSASGELLAVFISIGTRQ